MSEDEPMSSLLTSYDQLMQLTFTRHEGNPIIPHSGVSGDWKEWQVQESFVFSDPADPSRLIMYYSGARPPDVGTFSIGLAHATLADPFTWTDHPDNPILRPGTSFYNARYHRLDCMLYLDGVYWLYATGMSAGPLGTGTSARPGFDSIQLAHSTDGLNFTWHEAPVVLPSEDERDVSQSAVLKEGDRWYMYYSYRTEDQVLPGLRLAVSSDGVHWEKTGRQILSVGPGGYDAQYYEFHQALKLGRDYVLISECYDGSHWCAGVAHSTSPDAGWAKSDRPLLRHSGVPGAFDVHHVATPTLFDIGLRALLFYQGGNNPQDYGWSNWDIGVAASEELE